MAPAIVNYTAGTASKTSRLTITIPATTAGNTLLVVVTGHGTGALTVTGITLGGAAGNFTQRVYASNSTNFGFAAIWEDFDCAGGQTTVAVSVSGPVTSIVAEVYEVSGLVSTGAYDVSSGSTGYSTAWTSGTTGTTAQASEFVLGGAFTYTTTTGPASPWTNQTPIIQGTGASFFEISGYQTASATGIFTYSGTEQFPGHYAAVVATFRASTTPPVSGTGSMPLAAMRASGSGTQQGEPVTGTGSAALAPMRSSGRGTQQGTAVTGSGSMPLAPMRESASGTSAAAAIKVVSTTTANTLSVTIPATTAGSTLVVAVSSVNTTGPATVSGVTLGGSGTGFTQAAAIDADSVPVDNAYNDAILWVGQDIAGGQTAVVVSGTNLHVTAGSGGVIVYEITGLPGAVLDQSSTGKSDTGSSSWSSGTTGTTTTADEIWVGLVNCINGGPGAPGTPWTSTSDPNSSPSPWLVGYQVVSATGTATWSGTNAGGSYPWAAAVITLKSGAAPAVTGTGSAALAPMRVSGTAAEHFAATGSMPLAPMAMHGTAGENTSATGSMPLAAMRASGTGAEDIPAAGSMPLAPMRMHGTCAEQIAGTGTAALAPMRMAATGTGGDVTGTGTAALAPMRMSGTGAPIVPVTGSGRLPLAPLRESGSGTVVAAVTGSGSMPLAPMRIAGTGAENVAATGTAPLAPMRIAGTGAQDFTGTGSAALAGMRASGIGIQDTPAAGSVPLAPMRTYGAGAVRTAITAAGSAALAPMRISGSGSETGGAITGTGTIPLAPLRASGTGSVPLTATGSMPLAPMRTSGSITVPVIELISVTTASASTATIPATTAGNCLIVVITTSSASGASVSGITLGGAAGNFAQAAHAHAIVPGFDALDVFIWADADITGGHTTVVVSGTGLNLSSNGGSLTIYEVAGLSQSPAEVVDQVSTGSATSGATWSSGSTPETAQAAEFWVGAAITGEFIAVPGKPWTEDNAQSTASTGHQITTATGKAVYSGTQFESSLWSAAVVTFGTRAPAITGTGSLALAPLGMTGVQSLRAAGTLPLAAPGVAGTAVVTNPAPASGASAVPGIAIPGASVPGTPYRVVTPATAAGSAGLAPMAPAGSGTVAYHGTTVLAQWTGSRAIGDGSGIPAPPTMPLEVPVANSGTSGNGMVAFVSWTLPPGYPGADMAVTDDAHNVWWPLGAPATTSDPSGVTRSAIWACASPFAAAHVYVSPTGLPAPCYPAVIGVTIAEFTGFPASVMDATVTTGSANDATAVTADAAAPASAALILATGATSAWAGAPVQPSLTGTGWNALTGISATGGQTLGGVPEHALGTSPAWQTASAARDATWTAATAGGMSAATAVILTSAEPPAEQDGPEVYWPGWLVLAGIGSGALTPPGQVTWTDLTSRWITAGTSSAQTGKQYELDQLQAADDQITLDDNDGYLTPDNPLSPYYPDVTADVPIRILAWKNGRAYGYLAGYAERWPVNWDASWYGLVKPTLTDAWALQQNQLNSVLSQETTWDPNLYAYWPCSDPQYSISVTPTLAAQNLAPGNTNPLVVVTSKNGALAATQAFGAGGGSLPGDQSGSFWSQTGLTAADDGYGYALYCADDGYPPLSGEGMTVSAWFSPDPGGTPGTNPVQIEGSFDQQLIMLRAVNAGAGAVFQVYLQSPIGTSPGAITVAVWDASSRVRTNTAVYTGNWLQAGFLHMAITVTQTTWVLWINGARAGNGSCNLPEQVSWLEFMGSADRNYTGGMLNGQCGEISVYGCQLPADRIRSLYLAGSPNPQTVAGGKTQGFTGNQFATEYAHQRMERLWAYGGWAGPRSVSQSSTTGMEAITDIQGSTAAITAGGGVNLSAGGMQASMAVSNIVFSDGGFIYTDGCGTLCYYSRTDLYQTPNSWTLGEDTAAGEIPYLPSAILGYDKSLLYNGAELTPAASVTGAAITAANTPSIAAHGEFVYNAMAYQYLKALITDQANWIVNTRGTVTLRVQSLTCDAFANEDVWPLLLGIEPAQAVTVWRRPQEAPYTVELFPLVCQLTKTINFGSGTAKVKITTDMFPESTVMIIGDPVRGQATGANVLGW